MVAFRHLRLRKRRKARPLWFLQPRLPRAWRRKAPRAGDARRSRLKGLWRLALPLLRRLHRPAPPVFALPVREAEARRFLPIRLNTFTIRLAETADDIRAAQMLRYRVFYEELGAKPSAEVRAAGRDFDAYDASCDHLLVVDGDMGDGKGGSVVGTYRLLRRSIANRGNGFYSAQEFDLSPLMTEPGEIVELGRSCVDPAYRSRGVLQLLWRGLAAYVHTYEIDLMFGCGSFPGTAPEAIAAQLSYLYHFHLAPRPLRPRALDGQYVAMDRLPRASIDVQTTIGGLPPLIKGYLRVGGFVGDGAVVDHQFNTTDVCIIVKTDQLAAKYERHYRQPGYDGVRG
jgi:putative hemolysin